MTRVKIQRIDDENIVVLVDNVPIGGANHDEDGWAGMEKVEQIVEALAKALGADFGRGDGEII